MPRRRRTAATLIGLVGVLAAMIALTAASVPLYRLFCAATGYNGTTQRASSAPADTVASRVITVRFDATTSPGLDWDFRPEQLAVKVHPGESKTVAYRATNRGTFGVTGTATFNVTPDKVGVYFDKLQCFCFTRQHLGPGESKLLTVTFFVDPDIAKDADDNDVDTITLSYTMFRAKDQDGPGQTASSASAPTTLR